MYRTILLLLAVFTCHFAFVFHSTLPPSMAQNSACTCLEASALLIPSSDCTGLNIDYTSCRTDDISTGCIQTQYTDCQQDQNPTLWYILVAGSCAQRLILNVESQEDWKPSIVVYEGANCELTPLINTINNSVCSQIGINSNAIGAYNVEPDQLYRIAVSGSGDFSNPSFEICSGTHLNAINCLNPQATTFSIDQINIGGENWDPFLEENLLCTGETYEICFDFLYDASGTGADWLHGIIPSFGPGWDLDEFDPTQVVISPPNSFGQGGQDVDWYTNANLSEPIPNLCSFINARGDLELCNALNGACPCDTGMNAGDELPPGWFWLSVGGNAGCLNNGEPEEHWGIGSTTVNISSCFELKVKDAADFDHCESENNLYIGLMPFSDGVAGCWEDPLSECLVDVMQYIPLRAACTNGVDFEVVGDGISPDQAIEICSGELLTSLIDIVDQDNVSFDVIWSPTNDAQVSGGTDHTFVGAGSLTDVLINSSDEDIEVFYDVYVSGSSNACVGSDAQLRVVVLSKWACPTINGAGQCGNAEVFCDLDPLDNLSSSMPVYQSLGTGPMPLCPSGGIPNNMVWHSFIAPEVGTIEILITPLDCISDPGVAPSLQYGIYDGCDFSNAIVCNPDCIGSGDVEPISIELNQGQFVPGEEYWLFVDGCMTTQCEYMINVLQGGGVSNQLVLPSGLLCEDCELLSSTPFGNPSAEYQICGLPSSNIQIGLTDELGFYEGYTGSIEYHWSSFPEIAGLSSTTNTYAQSLQLDVAFGQYQICVDSMTTECQTQNGTCMLLNVLDAEVAIPEITCTSLTESVMQFCWEAFDGEEYWPEINTQTGSGDLSYNADTDPSCCFVEGLSFGDTISVLVIASNLCTASTGLVECTVSICDAANLITFYQDMDGDGYGDVESHEEACEQPSGYVENSEDCDDSNAAINPAGMEICDGVDNNCNDLVDEGLTFINFYRDADEDGFGDPELSILSCTQPMGYVENSNDCDDTNAAINPQASELCDGLDNNCNDVTDEGLTFITYYEDADGDGFGNPEVSVNECNIPDGFVEDSSDCDDTNSEINPNVEDIVNNGIDEDCDGMDAISSTHDLSFGRLRVYPNPVASILHIDYNNLEDIGLMLYDLSGKQISLTRHGQIEMSSFEPGVYLLKIIEKSTNSVIVERVVKQ